MLASPRVRTRSSTDVVRRTHVKTATEPASAVVDGQRHKRVPLLLETGIFSRPALSAPSGMSWVLGAATFWLLGFVLPLSIVAAGNELTMDAYTVIVLWGICLVTSGQLAVLMVARRPQLLRLAFSVFCYVFLGLAALAQVAASQFPTSRNFPTTASITDHSIISRTATLILVGFVAHEVAYQFTGRRTGPAAEPAPRPVSDLAMRSVLRIPIIRILCVVGLITTAIAVARYGLSPFFTSRQAVGLALSQDIVNGNRLSGLALAWYRISHAVPFAALFLLLHLLRRDSTSRTPVNLTAVTALAICNVIVNNPISNSRLWANAVLFGLLSVFVDMRRPRAVQWITVGMTSAFLLVFPYADATRSTGKVYVPSHSPLQELAVSGSFDAFQTAANGLRYVDFNGLTWGRQLVGSLFTLVPRSLWPSKPPDTGYLIDPIYNRAATIWTEMHVNFGLVGVLVGLALLGSAAKRLDQKLMAGRPWAVVLVPVLCPYYFILLRGTLSAAVDTLLPVLCVLVVGLVIREGRRPEQTKSQGPLGQPVAASSAMSRGEGSGAPTGGLATVTAVSGTSDARRSLLRAR